MACVFVCVCVCVCVRVRVLREGGACNFVSLEKNVGGVVCVPVDKKGWRSS